MNFNVVFKDYSKFPAEITFSYLHALTESEMSNTFWYVVLLLVNCQDQPPVRGVPTACTLFTAHFLMRTTRVNECKPGASAAKYIIQSPLRWLETTIYVSIYTHTFISTQLLN